MSPKIGLFLVGYKGFFVLKRLLDEFDSSTICFVVAGHDSGIDNDYYADLQNLCKENKISFSGRLEQNEHDLPDADLKYAIGWKWLIPSETHLVIFHDSLLPKYRGFSPLVNSLIANEKKLGVTALIASENYDQGPIIKQSSTNISYPITIEKAIKLIAPLYADLAISVYRKFLEIRELSGHEQEEHSATYSPWRDKLDYFIPWHESSSYIRRFCDAVGTPYKGACTYWGSRKIRVAEVKELSEIAITDRSRHVGKVIYKNNLNPVVICGTGIIQIEKAFYHGNSKSVLEDIPVRTRFSECLL